MRRIAFPSLFENRIGANLTISCHMFLIGGWKDGILILLGSFEIFVLLKCILLRIMRWKRSIKQTTISDAGNRRAPTSITFSSFIQGLPHIYLRLRWIQMLLVWGVFPAIVTLVKGMSWSIAVNAADERVAVDLIEVHYSNSVYNQMEKSKLLWACKVKTLINTENNHFCLYKSIITATLRGGLGLGQATQHKGSTLAIRRIFQAPRSSWSGKTRPKRSRDFGRYSCRRLFEDG